MDVFFQDEFLISVCSAVQLSYSLQSTPVIGQTGLITDSQHQTISGLENTESSSYCLYSILVIILFLSCPALSILFRPSQTSDLQAITVVLLNYV